MIYTSMESKIKQIALIAYKQIIKTEGSVFLINYNDSKNKINKIMIDMGKIYKLIKREVKKQIK